MKDLFSPSTQTSAYPTVSDRFVNWREMQIRNFTFKVARSTEGRQTAPIKVSFQPAGGNPFLVSPLNAFGAVKRGTIDNELNVATLEPHLGYERSLPPINL